MELIVKTYEELTRDELYEILMLRVQVFVVDQTCPYLEVDGRDQKSLHVYLRDEEGIQAYLRVLEKGVAFDEVAIGRVIAAKRRQGLGTRILREGIKVARERLGAKCIVLEAQTYCRSLYEKQGFRQTSEEFLDEGIPHIQMQLDLQ